MFKFEISIGDWSTDGHGKEKAFVVECLEGANNIEEIREVHFRSKEATGIDIENICGEYEDEYIPGDLLEDVIRILTKYFEVDDEDLYSGYVYSHQDMANLWLAILMETEPKLKLKLSSNRLPTLHFSGFDEKRRHIGQVGYGLFY